MKIHSAIAAVLVGAALHSPASAAQYPARPIRMIVPYAPGGASDLFARMIAEKLTMAWRQQVVVDNRSGAGGNIGSDLVAKANPDGYTMLLGTSGSNAVNPSLYTRMPYDAKRDLALVALVASTPNIIVVRSAHPAKSLQDLIRMAKANPGKVTYGSSGIGSVLHLSGELLKTMTGINIVHVPYKGTGPSLVDLLGGQIDMVFSNLPPVVPYVQDGRMRGIAVTTAERVKPLPNVPTMIESGVPGYDVASWFGVMMPAKTPVAVKEKLNREVQHILRLPDIKERLVTLGSDPMFMSVQDANRFFHSEIEKWAKVVKASGAKVN
ncbi:MAG TPA: tripartite tricarboxylate transporter substrate binding protein [Burkholderiales bacterium]|jgi:tripartite-type tricarboxylate transporter receptor subunit TctC|nr:tripartite tricarboxylate transporter substrate binding protein [Burkholderiales bacterium]